MAGEWPLTLAGARTKLEAAREHRSRVQQRYNEAQAATERRAALVRALDGVIASGPERAAGESGSRVGVADESVPCFGSREEPGEDSGDEARGGS